MNADDVNLMAELNGKSVAELFQVFEATILALRKQPGFDDTMFHADIKKLIDAPDLLNPNATKNA
jgi:hypothetical protein